MQTGNKIGRKTRSITMHYDGEQFVIHIGKKTVRSEPNVLADFILLNDVEGWFDYLANYGS